MWIRIYYSDMEKREVLPFAVAWTDLEGIVLSEIGQTEKDRRCRVSLNVWNLKEQNSQKQSRMVVTKGSGAQELGSCCFRT